MKSSTFSERGQALILIALSAVVLFGFVALAVDGSAKFSDRRHAQNAADTAAVAGALTLANGQTNWDTVARDRAGTNGYTGDLTHSTIWVFKCSDALTAADRSGAPFDCGSYEGNDNYLSVIILSHIDTTFGRVLGVSQSHNLVQAITYWKTAGTLASGAMIISYDPHPGCSSGSGSGGGSVDVSGSSTVKLTGGGIFVNSQETCGYSAPNCPNLTISNGAGINSAGTTDNIDQKTVSAGCNNPPAPENLNQTPLGIPDDIYIPDMPAECSQTASAYQVGTKWHITPGYYTDFPQYNINGDKIVANRKDIVMDPGVYCVGGNITWSGSTFNSLDGSSGVTIYVKNGYTFSLSINSPIKLYAPSSGTYANYLVIQNGTQNNIQNCKIDGGAYLDIQGIIYAPYCNITVNGGSDPTATINAQLAGWDIKVTGNNTINFNYNPNYVLKTKRKIGLMQ